MFSFPAARIIIPGVLRTLLFLRVLVMGITSYTIEPASFHDVFPSSYVAAPSLPGEVFEQDVWQLARSVGDHRPALRRRQVVGGGVCRRAHQEILPLLVHQRRIGGPVEVPVSAVDNAQGGSISFMSALVPCISNALALAWHISSLKPILLHLINLFKCGAECSMYAG